jgi:hypothetical protein
MNAIAQIKAGIKSAERAGKQADVAVLKAYLEKMEADHARKIAQERHRGNDERSDDARWEYKIEATPTRTA